MTEATATDIALTVDGIWSKRGLISAYLLMCDSLAGAGGGGGLGWGLIELREEGVDR